ncbi:MAG: nucleotidyltransferase family protein, partial [Enterococcus sp.]|nr:nucleotidyltransferase family protein [Enterococcus sp.]
MNKEADKLKILGIIAEYNPFHSGHAYHIKEAKERINPDFTVVIMSGNIVQRGDFACMDKYNRAEQALKNGIDLIIEMPTVFACSDAGCFARGGISILKALGITHLCFGAENPDEIIKIAELLQDKGIKEKFEEYKKNNRNSGKSFPSLQNDLITEKMGEEYALMSKKPNNILAIEYLKELYHTKIQPVIIRRQGSYYEDYDQNIFASASTIRKLIEKKAFEEVERICGYAIEKEALINIEDKDLYKLLQLKVIELSSEDIDDIASADLGFGSLVKKEMRTSKNLSEFKNNISSKRYTTGRINRFIIQLLLGITREDQRDEPKEIATK